MVALRPRLAGRLGVLFFVLFRGVLCCFRAINVFYNREVEGNFMQRKRNPCRANQTDGLFNPSYFVNPPPVHHVWIGISTSRCIKRVH